MWTTNDHATASGVGVVPALWQEAFEGLMSRIAGRFARVEPRRRVRRLAPGCCRACRARTDPTELAETGFRPARTVIFLPPRPLLAIRDG